MGGLNYQETAMKKTLSVWLMLVLMLLACRFSASDSTPAPMAEPVESQSSPTSLPATLVEPIGTLLTTVAYKTIEGVDPELLSLDIHAPANASNAPVVMWVHGGGYFTGDKANQMKYKIDLFNALGWILVSVNYRLSRPDKGAAQFPDHFTDVAAAVAWVQEHIADYGGDPDRIALLGHSAGADILSNVGINPAYLQAYGLNLEALTCLAPLDSEGFDKVTAGRDDPDGEQEQWKNALGNNPNYLTETSATLLIQPDIGIPPVLGVVRGNERRQQIEIAFLETLAAAGVPVTRIDAQMLSHNQVNSQIGVPGDTVMTEPLMEFLKGCFGE
jgi:acetyl esterase/lipase